MKGHAPCSLPAAELVAPVHLQPARRRPPAGAPPRKLRLRCCAEARWPTYTPPRSASTSRLTHSSSTIPSGAAVALAAEANPRHAPEPPRGTPSQPQPAARAAWGILQRCQADVSGDDSATAKWHKDQQYKGWTMTFVGPRWHGEEHTAALTVYTQAVRTLGVGSLPARHGTISSSSSSISLLNTSSCSSNCNETGVRQCSMVLPIASMQRKSA